MNTDPDAERFTQPNETLEYFASIPTQEEGGYSAIRAVKMTATITSFPIGNADSTRLTLADGQRLLFDFADMGKSDGSEISFDLKAAIKDDLRADRKSQLSVLCFTHLDRDHCFHAEDTFHWSHSPSRQAADRIKYVELWVPAAAIVETELESQDAKIIQAEAQHRLIKGEGIKVFSSPKKLDDWLKRRNLTIESRQHCIVHAGTTLDGFTLGGSAKAEFFPHCPLSWTQDEDGEVNRNEHSIVLHVTFREGGRDTRLLLGSDVDSDTLSEIVRSTKRHGNNERLEWDVLKLFHHCSYKALNVNGKEDDPTKPVPDVKWLMEDQGQDRSIIISSSQKIPLPGTKEDNDQPPHRKAANYYKKLQNGRSGTFKVTMDDPKKPIKVEISSSGASFLAAPALLSASSAAAKPMRAG